MNFKKLQKYVRHIIQEISHNGTRAAGVVVLKVIDDEPKVLVLRTSKNYDLPKGRIKQGEDPFECAIRETQEETGISDLDFFAGKKSIIISLCQMYCAKTNSDVTIHKNPNTNKQEHIGYEWMLPETAIRVLPNYLSKAVKWAMEHIQNADK